KRFPQDIQRSAIIFLPICFYLSEGRAVHFDRSGLWIAKEEQGRRMMTKGIMIGCFGLMLTACAEDQEGTGDRMQDRWQQMQKEVHDRELTDKAEFEAEKEEITSELREIRAELEERIVEIEKERADLELDPEKRSEHEQ